MTCLLKIRQLNVRIADKNVCEALDLDIERGQCWAILGCNGVGKTTLLHTLAGLRAAVAGTIVLDETPFNALSRRHIAQKIGVLFQGSNDAFPDTVLSTVLIGRHPHLNAWDVATDKDIVIARRSLAATGLEGMEQRLVSRLSGGERRRVALATVLTQDPTLYLLDEPVTHLDLHQQIAVLDLLMQMARTNNKAVVMTLHDVNLAVRYCDQVVLLFGNGTATHGPAASILNATNLQRLYMHPMISIAGAHGSVFLPG